MASLLNQIFSLDGKVIVITGASKGLGHGLAIAFAKVGANLVLASRTLPALKELAVEIRKMGNEVLPIKTDVTRQSDVQRLVELSLKKFGRIDVLFNNAGIAISGLLAENVTEEQFETILNTNLKGMFLCGTLTARAMITRRRGKIINMSSVFGERVWPRTSIYSTSKAAVNHMTRAWAVEWAPYHVTVNALAPSFIPSSLNKEFLKQKEVRKRVLSHLPLGRLGGLGDLVGPAIFLASDASNYMTGHVLSVDGGWMCL